MTLPNFFIAGVGRSGSSSLYSYVREHPDVYLSPVKEPGFFHWDDEPHRYEGPIDASLVDEAVTDLDAYRALFADWQGESAVGEATPSYLYNPKIPARIASRCPGARIIAILRDPAERAFSQYHLMCRSDAEPLSFDEALDAEADRTARNWGPSYHYAAQGFYAAQIAHWESVLGEGAVHVVFFDDLQHDAKHVVQDVFAHLGVDPGFTPHTDRVHNATYKPRRAWLHDILHGDDNVVKRIAKATVPERVRKEVWWRLRDRNKATAATLDPATRRRLVALYRDDVLQLQDRLGRDLSDWLRD